MAAIELGHRDTNRTSATGTRVCYDNVEVDVPRQLCYRLVTPLTSDPLNTYMSPYTPIGEAAVRLRRC